MNGKTACFGLLCEALDWFRLFSHFILSKLQLAAITASICVLEWGGERKLYLNRVAAAQFSGLVNLVFSRQTGLFECKRSWINKPTVIAEPTVPRPRLSLNLGSKLYPNNMQRMLDKDLLDLEYTNKIEPAKEAFCWQDVQRLNWRQKQERLNDQKLEIKLFPGSFGSFTAISPCSNAQYSAGGTNYSSNLCNSQDDIWQSYLPGFGFGVGWKEKMRK